MLAHLDAVVLLHQLHAMDRWRLVRRPGTVSPSPMAQVDQAIQISLGLMALSPLRTAPVAQWYNSV